MDTASAQVTHSTADSIAQHAAASCAQTPVTEKHWGGYRQVIKASAAKCGASRAG